MKVFALLAHPEPQSFNGALHRRAIEALTAAGHELTTTDLYADGFDPISDRRNFATIKDPQYFKQQIEEMHAVEQAGFSQDLEAEMAKVEQAELMIWQFPLWWFSVPAVLKGWVDRVFAMGRFYGGGKIYATGPLKGKRALISITTGGPREAYEPGGFNGDIHAVLKPIQRGMLNFVGLDVLAPHIVYAPARASDHERAAILDAYAARLKNIAAEEPIAIAGF